MFAISVLLAAVATGAGPGASWSWQQGDETLALTQNQRIVWQFNYRKSEPKTCFHPLTVGGSAMLTDFRPADHPWHRSLWFSWKSINGVYYWDEDKKTGKSPGETELISCKAEPHDDFSSRFELSFAYHPPGKPPVLTEQRVIEVSRPDASGGYFIDWQSRFTAQSEDVKLDRTPILGQTNGVAWGGYAGLSLRLSPQLRSWHFADAEGKITGSSKVAKWMSFSGEVAKVDQTPPGKMTAAVIVLDHPASFRHPTPWYLIQSMPYFSPAVLYQSPFTLKAGAAMLLKYRILLQPIAVDPDAVEKAWQAFSQKR